MKEKILTKNFICTFIAQLSLALVMYTLMSTITEYVTAAGATTTIAGLVSGMYVVGGLFSRIYSGSAMKRYSWKKLSILFGTLHLISSTLYFFADNIPLLLLIRFIHGVGFGATMNIVMIIAMAGMPKSRYGEATGYFMMSASLGVAIGPFLGGLIYDSFGGNGCFAAAMVFSLIIVIAISIVDTTKLEQKTESPTAPTEQRSGFGLQNLLEFSAIPISLCIFCMCFGYASLMSFYRLYGQYTNLSDQFQYFFLIYAAALIVTRPAAGKLQDRFGDNPICLPCMTAQVIGIALLAWKPCMLTITICALCGALGYGTMNSALNVIVNQQVSDERRPFAVTTYWAFSDLGVGIAPAILGAVVSAWNYHAMYYCAAFISLLALPIYWLCHGRNSR